MKPSVIGWPGQLYRAAVIAIRENNLGMLLADFIWKKASARGILPGYDSGRAEIL